MVSRSADGEFSADASKPESEATGLDREKFVQILFGSSAFQLLKAGCDLGLFELLAHTPNQKSEALRKQMGLSSRSIDILLLGTTSLGLTLVRDGCYSVAPIVTEFFPPGKWHILRDIVEFQSVFTIPASQYFTESLLQDTNSGIAIVPGLGQDLYSRLSDHPDLEAAFYRGMRSWSSLSNSVLVARAELSPGERVLDVGGGDGVNAIALASIYPDTNFTVMDMPGAIDIAREKIADEGLSDRIDVCASDIFLDEYPAGYDSILFANQLLIWSPDEIVKLLRRARRALSPSGAVMIFSAISDDDGSGPLYAALDNVYFSSLPSDAGFIYSWGQYEGWVKEAGFRSVERRPGGSWTPHGVIVGR